MSFISQKSVENNMPSELHEKVPYFVEHLHYTREEEEHPHSHKYFCIHVLIQGECELYVNGILRTSAPGTIALLSPEDNHAIYAKSEVEQQHLIFLDKAVSKKIWDLISYENLPYIMQLETDMFEEIKREFAHLHQLKQDAFGGLMAENILNRIVLSLISGIRKSDVTLSGGTKNTSAKAMQYIKTHFKENITLQDVADYLRITPNYFCRLFKKETGTTLKKYMLEQRLLYAANQLRATNDRITEISTDSGFNSTQHFYNSFKGKYGLSPVQYRHQYRDRKKQDANKTRSERDMSELFFEFCFMEVGGEPFSLSSDSTVVSPGVGYADTYLTEVLTQTGTDGKPMEIHVCEGIPASIIKRVGDVYKEDDEGYAIEITDSEMYLYAVSRRGFIYAVSTLKQLIQADKVSKLLLYDRPDREIRGYRAYTPGRDTIDDFKKAVDLLIEYKYNSIIIEVGAAMEYERHPLIQEKWAEFCAQLKVNNRLNSEIQKGYSWKKNCIQIDNGGSGYISKAELREVVAYCKERELEVIPEVPSLTHSDYILRAYPELRERIEDPYPDTYCPSNPRTYEVLFDIIDEVVEVFEPKFMNIGHDELYSIGLCDKCRDRDPVELFVNDIAKINDYLKAKGITAMMWCDKMLYKADGKVGIGAWAMPLAGIPDMGRTMGRVPKDVILVNWYWSLNSLDYWHNIVDRGYEDELQATELGYTMVYGNFSASKLTNYRKRMDLMKGGFVSNWGPYTKELMQRNRQYFDLAATAYTFWSHRYDSDQQAALREKVKWELQRRFQIALGEHVIRIRHTTNQDTVPGTFYGVVFHPEEWLLGQYIVTYQDGSEVPLPVRYFYNIGGNTLDLTISAAEKLYGGATPVEIDGKPWYDTVYANPYPDKEISGIRYEKLQDVAVEFVVLES